MALFHCWYGVVHEFGGGAIKIWVGVCLFWWFRISTAPLKRYSTQKWKFGHRLLTLKLLQTCMSFCWTQRKIFWRTIGCNRLRESSDLLEMWKALVDEFLLIFFFVCVQFAPIYLFYSFHSPYWSLPNCGEIIDLENPRNVKNVHW